MTSAQKVALERIYQTTRKLKKHSTSSYEQSKTKITLLFLNSAEYEEAIKTVAKILKY